jgi:hypothetical protein
MAWAKKKGGLVRTLVFPFAPADGDWKGLLPRLHEAWRMSTRLANWTVSQLAVVDQLTMGRTGAIGPFPTAGEGSADPYKAFRGFYPDYELWKGCTGSATCVFNRVRDKYKVERLEVIVRHEKSLPSFRYPYPFYGRAQETRAYYGKDNVPLLSLVLPGGRVVLRLRGGPEMRRQLDGFRRVVAGEARLGDVSVYKRGDRYLVGVAVTLPAGPPDPGGRAMLVQTRPDGLWRVWVEGHEGRWTHERWWHHDDIRPVVFKHREWLHRVAEDTKWEKRVDEKVARHIDQARDKRCRKYQDRVSAFCHSRACELANFAARQGVGCVLYDDREKGFLEGFNYSLLKGRVREKLGGACHWVDVEAGKAEGEVSLRPHKEKEGVACPEEKLMAGMAQARVVLKFLAREAASRRPKTAGRPGRPRSSATRE